MADDPADGDRDEVNRHWERTIGEAVGPLRKKQQELVREIYAALDRNAEVFSRADFEPALGQLGLALHELQRYVEWIAKVDDSGAEKARG